MKQFLYGYDQAGNRTSEQIDLGVTGANYNNVNELTTTIGGGPVRFVGHLDEPGTVLIGTNAATMGLQSTSFVGFAQTTLGTNVVTITATDYSSNSRTNRYQVVITNNSVARTLTYDLNGNETSSVTATATNTYEWDAADRIVAINSGPNRSEFTYDGMGRRAKIVEKVNGVAQNTNLFLWCSTELCEQRDSTGGTVSRRFFGRGEQISGTNYLFTRDHLGSVREMADGTGAIRARYEYDPYGRRTKVSGDLDADFAFTGHYYHALSGLYLALYRAYDSDTGRWLNRDPIQERGGLNLYTFTRNDPLARIDPLGLEPDPVAIQQLKATVEIAEFNLGQAQQQLQASEQWLEYVNEEYNLATTAAQKGLWATTCNQAEAAVASVANAVRQAQLAYQRALAAYSSRVAFVTGAGLSAYLSLGGVPVAEAFLLAPVATVGALGGSLGVGVGAGLLIGNYAPGVGGGNLNQSTQAGWQTIFDWWYARKH